MSDARLRRLERQSQAGEPAARARHLRERARTGDLAPDRLRLAAYLGDPAARGALGDDAPAAEGELAAWLTGLRAWGPEVFLRGLGAARAAAGEPAPAPSDPQPRAARPDPEQRAGLVVAATMAVCAAAAGDVRGVLAAGRAALGADPDAPLGGTRDPATVRAAVREALVPWALGAP